MVDAAVVVVVVVVGLVVVVNVGATVDFVSIVE